MDSLPREIHSLIVGKLDPVSARMYGETCNYNKQMVITVGEYASNNLICSDAAYDGYLEILKYAYESGCPWYKDTSMWAAVNGHLEILKYIINNEKNYYKHVCESASTNNHSNILNWMVESGNCRCGGEYH